MARGGQADFSDLGRQSRRDSPCPTHSYIQQASLGRLPAPANIVSNSGDWFGVLIASPSVHDRNGLCSTMLLRRTFLVRFKCIMSGPSGRFRTWDFASDRSEAKSNVHAVWYAHPVHPDIMLKTAPPLRRGAGNTASIQQEDGVWLENRKRDAARGDGEQENGIWQENRNRDAARGDGEQENGIWQENK